MTATVHTQPTLGWLADEIRDAIAANTQKRLQRKSKPNLPKRCRFHVMCGQAATRWAWHTHLQKKLGVCERCFETNDYLVEPKG